MIKRILLAYYSLSLQCSRWVSDDEAYYSLSPSAHGESVMMKRVLSPYHSLSPQCSRWVSDDEAYIISVIFIEPPVLTVSQWWWSVLSTDPPVLTVSQWWWSVLFTEPPVLTVSQWWWSVYYQRIIHWASSAQGESVMMKRILSVYYSLSLQCSRWVSDVEAYIISVLFTEPPMLKVSQWWWSVYYQRIFHWAPQPTMNSVRPFNPWSSEIFVYKPGDQTCFFSGFFSIWNHHKCLYKASFFSFFYIPMLSWLCVFL